MSNPNPDRDERVRQIRERLSDQTAQPTRDEVDYLLSQLENTADPARVERLEAQLQGVMNSLAISQQEVERLRRQIPQIADDRQSKLGEFGLRLIGESLLRDRENVTTTTSSIGSYEVIYDGTSRPIIQTPSGRWLSLSQFDNGRWQPYDREDSDCKMITEALNAATRMRDRCVAKVKAARKVWGGAAMPGHSVDQLITELESLTLEGEQE